MKSLINFIIEPILVVVLPLLAVITAVHVLLVWLGWIDPTSYAQCLLSLLVGVIIWAVGVVSLTRYQERRQ